MSSSLILTNCLFCCIAALLLLPLLKHPNILTYKKGIPIFIVVIVVLIKMLIPYEFSFTHTLASKNILPAMYTIGSFNLVRNVTIGNVLLYVWALISIFLLLGITFRYVKLMKMLSIVPETGNKEIIRIMSELCIQNQIRNKPKVIQLDIDKSPFIVGLRHPIVVLPHFQLSENEIKFILLHELEHLEHRHLFTKMCIEIVIAIYWWNPIVWLLRREVICALEMQADTHAIQGLCNEVRLSYLEVLLRLQKETYQKQDSALSLSFSLKSSMVEYRIQTALKYNCFQEKTRTSIFYLWSFVLSVMLLIFSFTYTFETYKVNPMDVEGTFTLNMRNDYLSLREDGRYDLYINEEYVTTILHIPNDLSNIPIHR